MGSAAVLLVTGVILMFFYVPSSAQTVYQGGYAPLHGAEVSKAFASTLGLSMDVSGGLLLRQAHHWAGPAAAGRAHPAAGDDLLLRARSADRGAGHGRCWCC